MFLQPYYYETEQGIAIGRQQASLFAKTLADDFNPIHDPDSKRFCVPGDLLFALLLTKLGLFEHIHCQFTGMVGSDTPLLLQHQGNQAQFIGSLNQKSYLAAEYRGQRTEHSRAIEQLIRSYVRFSGQTFPHILHPLMQAQQVMIHPTRPLVIYESMSLDFQRLPISQPELQLTAQSLLVEGKRGNVLLEFEISEEGEPIGTGQKCMILSGLLPYVEADMTSLISNFYRSKDAFCAELS